MLFWKNNQLQGGNINFTSGCIIPPCHWLLSFSGLAASNGRGYEQFWVSAKSSILCWGQKFTFWFYQSRKALPESATSFGKLQTGFHMVHHSSIKPSMHGVFAPQFSCEQLRSSEPWISSAPSQWTLASSLLLWIMPSLPYRWWPTLCRLISRFLLGTGDLLHSHQNW